MRDPARIDRITEHLRAAWHANPDLRLGQLIVNAQRWMDHVDVQRVVFMTEDERTEIGLQNMLAESEMSARELEDPAIELSKLRARVVDLEVALLESVNDDYCPYC
jgi:hypothetical protein